MPEFQSFRAMRGHQLHRIRFRLLLQVDFPVRLLEIIEVFDEFPQAAPAESLVFPLPRAHKLLKPLQHQWKSISAGSGASPSSATRASSARWRSFPSGRLRMASSAPGNRWLQARASNGRSLWFAPTGLPPVDGRSGNSSPVPPAAPDRRVQAPFRDGQHSRAGDIVRRNHQQPKVRCQVLVERVRVDGQLADDKGNAAFP